MGRKFRDAGSLSNKKSPGHTKWHLDASSRLAIIEMGRKLVRGLCALFGEGQRGPHLTQSHLGWGLAPYQVASWSMQPFGRNRYGPKIGWGLCPFGWGGAGSPSNTMWPGPRPTCTPSFILIRPTVWPQCTNVTDKTGQTGQDRQRTDIIGRTVLQTVAQQALQWQLSDVTNFRCHKLIANVNN